MSFTQALLDNFGWLDLTDNSTCAMQTRDQMPQEFYVRGWIQYNDGVQAACSSDPINSDTLLVPPAGPAPNVTSVSG